MPYEDMEVQIGSGSGVVNQIKDLQSNSLLLLFEYYILFDLACIMNLVIHCNIFSKYLTVSNKNVVLPDQRSSHCLHEVYKYERTPSVGKCGKGIQ